MSNTERTVEWIARSNRAMTILNESYFNDSQKRMMRPQASFSDSIDAA